MDLLHHPNQAMELVALLPLPLAHTTAHPRLLQLALTLVQANPPKPHLLRAAHLTQLPHHLHLLPNQLMEIGRLLVQATPILLLVASQAVDNLDQHQQDHLTLDQVDSLTL